VIVFGGSFTQFERLAVGHWSLALKNVSLRIIVEIRDDQLLAFSF